MSVHLRALPLNALCTSALGHSAVVEVGDELAALVVRVRIFGQQLDAFAEIGDHLCAGLGIEVAGGEAFVELIRHECDVCHAHAGRSQISSLRRRMRCAVLVWWAAAW